MKNEATCLRGTEWRYAFQQSCLFQVKKHSCRPSVVMQWLDCKQRHKTLELNRDSSVSSVGGRIISVSRLHLAGTSLVSSLVLPLLTWADVTGE